MWIYMLCTLICVQGIVACGDDPEPVVEPEPDTPDTPDPVITEWHSWFDTAGEYKWPIFWAYDDDPSYIYGPGKYEFNVPSTGTDFSFFFPLGSNRSMWMNFNEMFYFYNPQTPNSAALASFLYGVKFKGSKSSYSFEFSANHTDEKRELTVCFRNGYYGSISYLFVQDAGNTNIKTNEGSMAWKSERHLIDAKKRKTLCHSDGEKFSMRCINYDNLEIESLTVNNEAVDITDRHYVKSGESTFSTENDILTFDIAKNDSGIQLDYKISVRSAGQEYYLTVQQPADSHTTTEFCERRDPVWTMDDGTTWTGSKVFKIPYEGAEFEITNTNYSIYSRLEILMNGEANPFLGPISNFMYVEGGKNEPIKIKIFRNYFNEEHVFEVKMLSTNDYLQYDEYSIFTFVQAPKYGVWQD